MKKSLIICTTLLLLSVYTKGQDSVETVDTPIEVIADSIQPTNKDTAWVKDEKIIIQETLAPNSSSFKPDPKKAVIYSAIFPGLGQIYNRKYWKLPIVYGGFLGLSYAISWNNRYYGDYSTAYKAISNEDPMSQYDKWGNLVSQKYSPGSPPSSSDIERYKSGFKRQKDSYRRYRDLSIIGAVALYALCMIDAYVDAHLFDFDMSPDLSLKVEPTVMSPTAMSGRTYGVQCSLKF